MSLLPPTTRALIWKEWLQNRDRFVLLLILTAASSALVVASDPKDWKPLLMVVQGVLIVVAAVFLGLGIAAGEPENQTASTLAALPAGRRRVAFVKLLVGLATLPLLAVAGVLPGWLLHLRISPQNPLAAFQDHWSSTAPACMVMLLSIAIPSLLWLSLIHI